MKGTRNKRKLEEELFTFLEKRLPHYMIPSSIIVVNEFDYTSNGKVDIKKMLTQLSTHQNDNKVPFYNTVISIFKTIILGRDSFTNSKKSFKL